MQKTEITAQYVNEPKPGKANGSIKDTSGQYWSCKPEFLAQIQQGQTVGIEWNSQTYDKPDGSTQTTHSPLSRQYSGCRNQGCSTG